MRRKKKSSVFGAALIAVSFAIVIAIAIALVSVAPNSLDQYGCDQTEITPRVTAFLFDVSDPLSERQREDVRRRYFETLASLPVSSRVEVYQLVANPDQLLEPIWQSCKPQDVSATSGLVDNPQLIKRHYQEEFIQPASRALDAALSVQYADKSPIFEAVQSVAIKSLSAAAYRDSWKELIVISDLLQNTDGFSNYRSGNDFRKLSDKPYYRSIRSDLRGVRVIAWYLWRPGNGQLQSRSHAEFWGRFFREQEASFTAISIQG